MNLINLRNEYMQEGYGVIDANAKVCQDIMLLKIGKSSLADNITIKGGVVMQHISKDLRRATRDLDLDFIKYSLEDESIRRFIERLNEVSDNVKLKIVSEIVPLNHQDYNGKQVYVQLADEFDNNISVKLDIGVHKDFDIKQDEYCFDLNLINQTASLLINSKEQIFTEKLKSLLKFDVASTRIRDFFDFYYLINHTNMDKNRLMYCIDKFIFKDKEMDEYAVTEIYSRLESIFNDKIYRTRLINSKKNWLGIDIAEGIESVLLFIKTLE